MREFGFVNFEDHEENLEDEEISNEEIAEEMGINVNELESNFTVLLLGPLTEVICCRHQNQDRNYRTYTVNELIDETNMIIVKLSVIGNSYVQPDRDFLTNFARTRVVIHTTVDGVKGCDWLELPKIIAVTTKDGKLLKKDFNKFSDQEYLETRQFLIEHELITYQND